jgi:hypothetical protein
VRTLLLKTFIMENEIGNLFRPTGLSKNVFLALDQCRKGSKNTSLEALLVGAEEHVEKAQRAHARNGIANVKVAAAIYDVFKTIVDDWDNITSLAQPWCIGMMRYFTSNEDDENDFNSPIGFDDAGDLWPAHITSRPFCYS